MVIGIAGIHSCMSRDRTDTGQYGEKVTDDPVWGTEPIPGDETVSEGDIDDVLYGDLDE
jgi:hypothetical protein